MTSSGSPSARNTRLFAMAPTSQPSAAAAAAAVRAESGSTRTWAVTPASLRCCRTIWLRAGNCGSSVIGHRPFTGFLTWIVHEQDHVGRGAESGEPVRQVAAVAQALTLGQF